MVVFEKVRPAAGGGGDFSWASFISGPHARTHARGDLSWACVDVCVGIPVDSSNRPAHRPKRQIGGRGALGLPQVPAGRRPGPMECSVPCPTRNVPIARPGRAGPQTLGSRLARARLCACLYAGLCAHGPCTRHVPTRRQMLGSECSSEELHCAASDVYRLFESRDDDAPMPGRQPPLPT